MQVSFSFSVLVWSFLLSYFMFIFCEAPTGRLDKLIFEARRATKKKELKDEVPNANDAEEMKSQVVPTLRDSNVVQNSSGTEVLNGSHNDKARPTSSHL